MKHIYILHRTKVHEVIVDDDDYERLSQHHWSCIRGYAARLENKKLIYMHHEVLLREADLESDHINRNRLDNRKENIRNVTRSVNGQNRCNNTSGVEGVTYHVTKWKASIFHGKRISLGVFNTREEAAQTRQEYIREHKLQ